MDGTYPQNSNPRLYRSVDLVAVLTIIFLTFYSLSEVIYFYHADYLNITLKMIKRKATTKQEENIKNINANMLISFSLLI